MKTLLKIIIFIIIIYILCALALFVIGSKPKIKDVNALNYILVLGAHVDENGPSKSLSYRLDTTYDFVIANNLSIPIIVSGGKGLDEPDSEANVMKAYLVNKGLNASQIIIEDQSTNTNENLKYSKKLMSNGYNVLIVSNNYHLPRASFLARRHQLIPSTLPTPASKNGSIKNILREPLAFIKSLLLDQ
ncbi:MAG: YdcF family protein [Bacilli bacterium]